MKKNIVLMIIAVSAATLFSLFAGRNFINPFSLDDISGKILFSVRLPRVLTSLLVGSALGTSGAVLQGVLRNPLADPYILGISSGAALFAGAGLIIGSAFLGPLTVPLLAFAGACLTCAIVGVLGYRRGILLPERLLLAGLGLGFLFTAILMLIMSLSSAYGTRRALLWIFGDLSMSDWSLIPYGFLLAGSGLTLAIARRKGLNALILGDEVAFSLGFSPSRERLLLFASVSLMTATAISLGGVVGFVGLLIPHIVRFLAGSDAKVLLPLSAISGAGILVIADTVGRTVVFPSELPAGVITSIVGAPYFLYLLRKKSMLGMR
ncbi:MAG: iron ABC transporter permease [Deltaproteobacteria bacterium]|nr:iron ABC transporter permease [Deltaproteobacteria bacterium]